MLISSLEKENKNQYAYHAYTIPNFCNAMPLPHPSYEILELCIPKPPWYIILVTPIQLWF